MHRSRVENIQNILGIELHRDIAARFHQPLCGISNNRCYERHQRATPAHLGQPHHAGGARKFLEHVLDVSLTPEADQQALHSPCPCSRAFAQGLECLSRPGPVDQLCQKNYTHSPVYIAPSHE